MRKALTPLRLCILSAIGIALWLTLPHHKSPEAMKSPSSPLVAPSLSGPAAAAKPQLSPAPVVPPVVVPPREEKLAPTLGSDDAQAPAPPHSAKARDDFYASARVLAERVTPPDKEGRFQKLRLIERPEDKYPFTRVEETWERDPATGHDRMIHRNAMVADHFVVQLQEGQSRETLEGFVKRAGGAIRRQVGRSPVFLVSMPTVSLAEFDRMLATLREPGSPARTAEPDFVVHTSFTPNDPSFSSLWGLHNTGQTGGTGDADVDAIEAWDASRGSANVVVGVIDTGVDYTHPDLAANMWVNAGEVPNNGLDDDNNGYVDDTRGWDFVSNDKDPMDDHYHGTHCAGTIGAVGHNGIGVAGVCHTVKMMALKFLSASGSGTTSDAIEAVLYATDNGATLTSNSWGGGGYSHALKDAIDAAQAQGILFVAAAGNDSRDTDAVASYPASYSSANIISVAATDHKDLLAYFSNYGATTVDLAAPGVSVYSTSPGSGYRSLSGTSMACPHVAGACALLLSARPSMIWSDVKTALLNNVDPIASLTGKAASAGRLNVARSVIIATEPYIAVTGMQVSDGNVNGASGNGNGILNPGEDFTLGITLKNAGGKPAAGLTTQVTIVSGAAPLTLLTAQQVWGSLAVGASASNNATPFRLRLAPVIATPHKFTLRVTTRDNAGQTWTADSEYTVLTNSTISGKVVASGDGSPIVGATITYAGPSSGSVTTGAGGTYTLNLTNGTYLLRAIAAGFNPSTDVSVSVPPNRTGLDFPLGRARLAVAPTSLSSTQFEGTVTQHTLTLSNTGDQPLNVTVGTSSVANSASTMAQPLITPDILQQLGTRSLDEASSAPPPAFSVAAGAVTPLPFEDGFESGTLDGWNVNTGSGTREVVNTTAAVGSQSFHFDYTGVNGHFNGIHREFAAGTRPKYVSFWVRPGSTSAAAGYSVLQDNGFSFIWFFAKDNGRLYVNADVGGDESVVYQAGVWYRIEFKDIDWTTKTFDYYVNGALVKANIPFRYAAWAQQITQLHLYNFSTSSEAWWDQVRVLSSTVDWLGCTPTSLIIPPGQSAPVQVTMDATNLLPGVQQARLEFNSNDPANPFTTVPVTLTVQPEPNSPPVAQSGTVVLNEDAEAVVTLQGTDADGHAMTAQITELPAAGAVYQTTNGIHLSDQITAVPTTVLNGDRKVIYVPPVNANGSALASFKFVLLDRRTQSAPATVTLNVTPVNDVPVAYGDIASGLPGEPIASIPVLANDIDADGDTLSILSFTQGIRGVVTDNGDGTLRYVLNAGFTQAADSFSYTLSDGHGGTATAIVAVAVGYLAAGDWPTMGNGPTHSGYYPASLAGQTLTPSWTLTFSNPLNQSAIAGGRVFATPDINQADAPVSAIDLATGTVAWRKTLPRASSITGPTYHQGRIYVQRCNHDSDSQVWSLDAATGATVWSKSYSSQWQKYLSPTVTDTTVYVPGGYDNGIYGFDRVTGTQAFFNSMSSISSGWTPGVGNNTVYSCIGGFLRAHHASTGVPAWTYTVDAAGTWNTFNGVTPVYLAGHIYVIGGNLYSVNVTSTPSQAWKATGNFRGTPAVANGKVYALTTSANRVQQVDAASGAILGEYLTPGANCTNQPIVTTDTLIVASSSKVFVFDLSTRALLQTIDFGGIVSLSNGHLIIAGADNILRCYSVMSGINEAPLAQSQTATCTEDEFVTLTLGGTDADGNPLLGIISTLPAKGTLYQTSNGLQLGEPITIAPALVTNSERKVIYRPAPDGFGSGYTNFAFKVHDGTISSAEATVTLDVTGVNDAPRAVNDHVYVTAGQALDPYLPTANDVDVDGEPLQIVSFTQPGQGIVSQNADGSLRYASSPNATEGTDVFTYTLRDSLNQTSTATVEVLFSTTFGREWPTFGNGPDHTGRYAGSLGATPFVERWQFATGAAIHAPAVAEGKVFYSITWNGTDYLHTVALDAVTGGEIWRTQLNPANALNPPTYFKGAVYLQRGKGSGSQDPPQLLCLNAGDGVQKWEAPFAAQSERYMAPCVSDLGVYVNAGMYGGIYGFNQNTGAQKFFLSLEQIDEWTPSLHGGALYSFVGKKFRNHDLTTGAVIWTLEFAGGSTFEMLRTVAFDDGRAYLVNGSELVCIDLGSRTVLWRATAAFKGTPAVMNGIVYALSGGSVKTYGALNGLWLGDLVAPGESSLLQAPLVSNDILVASGGSKTYLFNLNTRQVFQTFNFGSQFAAVDGTLYFSCSDNFVRAYSHIPAGNAPPTALSSVAEVAEESQISLQLEGTDPDGDTLSFTIRSLPANGTLYQTLDGVTRGAAISRVPAFVKHRDGKVIYVGAFDAAGASAGSFTFTAHDAASSSAAATMSVNVIQVNDAPRAVTDVVALRPGEELSNYLPQTNDRDPDGDVLTVVAVTPATSGKASLIADGTVQYSPNAGFVAGTDAFTYTVRDSAGLQSTATITVHVSSSVGRDWPTFGANSDRNGHVPIKLGSSAFALRWTSANLSQPPLQVAVAGGKVYSSFQVASVDSKLLALDSSSGAELWRVNFNGGRNLNAPSAYGGDVFMQFSNTSNSRLYALHGTNGATKWSSPFGAQILSSYYAPAVDADGIFINGGTFGGLYAFNVGSGAQLFFNSTLEQFDGWTPTLHQGGLYSYMEGIFRSHNRATGAVIWSLDFDWTWSGLTMNRAVACANQRAFLVNDSVTIPAGDQELISVDLQTRTAAWKVRGKFYETPAVAHQTVFVIAGAFNTRNTVQAYDALTGAFLGAYTATGETGLRWQPIVTEDCLIAYSNTKTYVFDLKTRALRQTINFGGYASLAGVNLYIASANNLIRSFGVPDVILNHPPTATPLALTIPEESEATATLSGTDADNEAVSFVITRLPGSGTLYQTSDGVTRGAAITTVPTAVPSSPSRVIYVPVKNGHGAGLGSFGYSSTDTKTLSPEATVTINVTPVNDVPVAIDDARMVHPGRFLSPVRETLNDYDGDGEPLPVVSFTQPAAGIVERNADGTLRYTPPADVMSGTEQFQYTVQDGAGISATATVSVTISEVIEGHWPMYGNGPGHSGHSPTTLGRTGWVPRWTHEFSGALINQAAVAEGKVFVSGKDATTFVAALGERSGHLLWRRNFASASSMNAPSYHDGRIYAQRANSASDTQMLALDAGNGDLIWSATHTSQGGRYFSPVVSNLGVFCGGGASGGMYGFDRTTGTQLFFRNLAQTDQWTPAIHGGALYSFINGLFTSHDPSSGADQWSLNLGWGGFGFSTNRTIALHDRSALVVNDSSTATALDEDLVCIDLDSHTATWTVNGEFAGTPAIHDGIVYVVSANTVQARSAADGRFLHAYAAPAGEFLAGQPIVADDVVIAQSGVATYIFGRFDHTLLQGLPRGGSMSVGDDQLIVAGADGVVAAYAAQPAVTFFPHGGMFERPVEVVLSAAEPGGRIHYTLDGSRPDLSSPWVPSGRSILVSWTGKIRAILEKGSAVSREHEADFVMRDSDNDGLPDWWENDYFSSLASSGGGTADQDNDGKTDAAELQAGTDPSDANERFCVKSTTVLQPDGDQLTLSWESRRDRFYIIEKSMNIGIWEPVTQPIEGTGGLQQHTLGVPPSGCFFRVGVWRRIVELEP